MSRVWHSLAFPSDVGAEAVLAALRPLAAEERPPLLAAARPVVFELTLERRGVVWRVGAERYTWQRLRPVLDGALPGIDTVPSVRVPNESPVVACELKLVSGRRPLDVSTPEVVAHRLLDLAGRLRADERIVLQWAAGPWIPRPPVPPTSEQEHERTIWNLNEWGRPVLDSEQISAARRKASEHILGCVGRIAIWGTELRRARQLVSEIVGAYQLLRAPGVGISRRWLPSRCVAARLERFHVPKLDPPCRLTLSELATVIGWPVGNPEVAGVSYRSSRVIPPDPRTLTPEDTDRQRIIGESAAPSRPGFVVLPIRSALKHTHVLGPTGSGKSWMLANLILRDIAAGRSVVAIDAKGDLATDVIARLPEALWPQVALLDPTDDAPLGLNPLATGEAGVDGLVYVMQQVWSSSWGPRLGDIVHAGALTLARSRGHSLVELPLLLTNASFRRSLVAVASRQDPIGLASFWGWYENLSEDARAQVLAPVMNKLRSILLRPDLRAVLGQPTPRLDLRDVFRRRQSVLIRLNRGRLGPSGAELIGSLLMSTLWQAALGRTDLPAARRRTVVIYLDEFQEFLRLNIDLGDALAQARGLGVGLVLAHQHLGQIDLATRAAILANAGSRIVFGIDSDDAAIIAKRSNGSLRTEDITELASYHAYASVMVEEGPTKYGSIRTLPLPPATTDLTAFESFNRDRFGVPRSDTEGRLAELLDGTQSGERPSGVIGARRRPRGQS